MPVTATTTICTHFAGCTHACLFATLRGVSAHLLPVAFPLSPLSSLIGVLHTERSGRSELGIESVRISFHRFLNALAIQTYVSSLRGTPPRVLRCSQLLHDRRAVLAEDVEVSAFGTVGPVMLLSGQFIGCMLDRTNSELPEVRSGSHEAGLLQVDGGSSGDMPIALKRPE
ncbi:hypothetical protein GY45DRAFT_847632 [Cubamyces sp. BRFM 1775]|nr:hypothetical protein GY45DRAFT_847632 [Cubamyces sp. BRFM 1775]